MNDAKRLTNQEARGCPFCGDQPTIEKWHGGGPQQRMIACGNDYCKVGPLVTGPTRKKALEYWNTRDSQS